MKRINLWRLAKDTSGSRIEVFDQFGAEVDHSATGETFREQQSLEAVADADHLPSQFTSGNGCTHNHCICAGNKARPYIDCDTPVRACMTK